MKRVKDLLIICTGLLLAASSGALIYEAFFKSDPGAAMFGVLVLITSGCLVYFAVTENVEVTDELIQDKINDAAKKLINDYVDNIQIK